MVVSYFSETVHHMGLILADEQGELIMIHYWPEEGLKVWLVRDAITEGKIPVENLYTVEFHENLLYSPVTVLVSIAKYQEKYGSYDPIENNCEHFVTTVTLGPRYRRSFSTMNVQMAVQRITQGIQSSRASKGKA